MRASPSPFDFPGDSRGVLLLHGLTGTPHDMRFLGERLHARGPTVVGPMMAGHGGTADDLAATTWQDWVAGAADALASLQRRCEVVAVVGQSMGALSALYLASEPGARLAAVASLAAPLWLEGLSARAARWIGPGGWLAGRVRTLPKLGGSDVGVAAERRDTPSLRVMPAPAVVNVVELMGVVRARLERVAAPLLVLHGARDHTAPPASATELATRARAERARLLPASRHVLSVDVDKDVVAAELITFLERHLGARSA